MAESEEELKSLLIKVKEESEKKTSLKLNIQKIKSDTVSSPFSHAVKRPDAMIFIF